MFVFMSYLNMRAQCPPQLIILTEFGIENKQARYTYDVEMTFKLTAYLSQKT